MKLIRLQAENIKRLKAIEIVMTDDAIIIGGANGQGKSAALDSIEYALRGKSAMPAHPVRRGTRKGKVLLEFDSIVVKRTITKEGKTTLEVSAKDGTLYPSPQAVLDKLYDKIGLDPLTFYRAKPKEQVAMLREIVGEDDTALNAERESVYNERTVINRQLKEAEAVRGNLQLQPEPEPVPATDELVGKLQMVEDRFRLKGNMWAQKDMATRELANLRKQRMELDVRISTAETQLQVLDSRVLAAEEACIGLPDPEELRAELKGLDERRNTAEAIRRQNAAYLQTANQAKGLKDQSEALTERLQQIDEQKAASLAAMAEKMPMPGLGFGEDGLVFNGIPLEQCSSSEQLRVATALAMAKNPELKLLLIREGAFLDEERRKELIEVVKEMGAQVLLEVVGEGPECSLIIEDGGVKNQ